jgi:hypothetical protein
MGFLTKPVARCWLGSRTDDFSNAPGAVSKPHRILGFARIVGKGSHEGQTHQGADSGSHPNSLENEKRTES